MFRNSAEIILASGSPRRRRFLAELGLGFSVRAADVDESERDGETPEEFVRRLSLEKAMSVSLDTGGAFVIGADTIVTLEGKILGKPKDSVDALRILKNLSGKTHDVWTGFTICKSGENCGAGAVRTEVTFINAGEDILSAYVDSREPLDKAGAYGIQGLGGVLVKKISGSYSNVVGLPMAELIKELLRLGVIEPDPDFS